MSMKKYMIRTQVQKPIRVQLVDIATGMETQDWLEIRSSLSDEFTIAREDINHRVRLINEPNKDKRQEMVAQLQLELKAALVSGWSFDEPFTQSNLLEFLKEAPQVQNMIMVVADDAARFFETPSATSSDGQGQK